MGYYDRLGYYYDDNPYALSYTSHTLSLDPVTTELYYGKKYYLNGKDSPTMHPGTLTLADADGNAITIEPTGKNGYTVHTTPEPVRINSKMDDALRGHASRCLSYAKPKPVAELES